MKKSTVYCSLIIMFFLSPIYSSQHSYHVVKNTGYQVQQINNPQYTLESKLLSKFYLTLEIPIITLKQKNSQKIIAQFQLPHELQQKELPQFSFNNKYLLILNAPWRLFYANQPSTYEWNLFDIDARKTIKTFPRESYPRFISKTEIQYNESQTYQIQQKYPGFLSKIINFFLPQKQNDASLIISQTNQINKEPQTNTVTPHTKTTPMSTTATTTLPIQIISNQTNEPIVRQTTTEEELEPIQSTADTQNQDIISYKRPQHHKTLLRTFNFLVKTAQLSPSVQLPIIKKYVSSLQSSPSYYKDIKAIMVTQSPVETSYNKALELLHTIETLSSSMNNEIEQNQDIETIFSPAIIEDFVTQVKNFCSIVLTFSSQEKEKIILQCMQLINKYKDLYNKIIKQMFVQKPLSPQLPTNAYAILKYVRDVSVALQNNTISSIEGIKKIDLLSKQLDILYPSMDSNMQMQSIKMQTNLVKTYHSSYAQALQTNYESHWKNNAANVIKIASFACFAGMTSALISLLTQNFYMLLGSTATIDINTLITQASTAILANVIMQLSEKKFTQSTSNMLAGAGAHVISETAIMPYLQKAPTQPISLQYPSVVVGPIQAALAREAFSIINTIITQQGGVSGIIQKTNFKNLLLRPTQQSHNEITLFLLPKIQTFIDNKNISFTVSAIGWKLFSAALIGAGMYMAGIGYNENIPFIDALYYESLESIKKICIATLLATTTKKTGGLISFASALALPSTTMINSFITGTEIVAKPEHIIPEILKTSAEVVTDFIVDEKGFKNTLKTMASSLKESVKTHLPNFYDIFYIATQGFTEVNPPQDIAEPVVSY